MTRSRVIRMVASACVAGFLTAMTVAVESPTPTRSDAPGFRVVFGFADRLPRRVGMLGNAVVTMAPTTKGVC